MGQLSDCVYAVVGVTYAKEERKRVLEGALPPPEGLGRSLRSVRVSSYVKASRMASHDRYNRRLSTLAGHFAEVAADRDSLESKVKIYT